MAFELDAPALRQLAEEAASSGKALPAVWKLATGEPRKRSARSAAAIALLPLMVGGAAYYYFYASQAPAQPHAAPKVEAAQESKPQPQEVAAPAEAAHLQATQPAPAPAVSAKILPPRAAATHSRSAPPPEPKRATVAVTHTRAASANASSRTALVEAPIKTTAGTLPVVTAPVVAAPVVAAPALAASAAIMPVSESPPAIAEDKRLSVTHTKADLTEAAITTTPPAASTERTLPAETRSDELAGCVPAVVALGLCKSK